jgi:hypothetical protein
MNTQSIEILDPGTGKVVDVCRGLTSSGRCPRAGMNGVVPCASHLIRPPGADRRLVAVVGAPELRYCDLGWNAKAISCLTEAGACRDKWKAGAASETRRVFARAAAGDPRYRAIRQRTRAGPPAGW